jgi:hypothetical protein
MTESSAIATQSPRGKEVENEEKCLVALSSLNV